nr:ankyrin-3-like [Halyomorpha halys]
MTEASKRTLRFHLDRAAEKVIEDTISWAQIYELRYLYTSNNKTPYMIASLVYLYETSHGRPNNIGRALCETIDDFDEDEAKKILRHFRFPVITIYNVFKEWKRTNDIPHLFNVELIAKEYEIMHAAASRDDLDVIHWLFRYEIDVDIRDSFGKTPLHIAAAHGFIRITRFLLSHGACVFSLDQEHQTPIEVALMNYRYEMAEFLKPDLFCNLRLANGETLLMRLIGNGLKSQVKYMLRYADFEVLNYQDQNVLHVCALSGHTKVMGLLLRGNISPDMLNARDAFNQTPLSLAIRQSKSVMVQKLLAAGAEITPSIKNMNASRKIRRLLMEYDQNPD